MPGSPPHDPGGTVTPLTPTHTAIEAPGPELARMLAPVRVNVVSAVKCVGAGIGMVADRQSSSTDGVSAPDDVAAVVTSCVNTPSINGAVYHVAYGS